MKPSVEKVITDLQQAFGEMAGQDLRGTDANLSFFELGLDSLFLTQAAGAVKNRFAVKVTFRQLNQDLSCFSALAGYVVTKLSDGAAPPPPVAAPVSAPAAPQTSAPERVPAAAIAAPLTPSAVYFPSAPSIEAGAPLERVVKDQLRLMEMQLALLSGKISARAAQPETAPAAPGPAPSSGSHPVVRAIKAEGDETKRFGPFKGIERGPTGGLTPGQEKALAELVGRYNKRTAGSKRLTQGNRRHFCDPRAAGNFRQLWKEMVYPLSCARSLGSRIWDIDGNEYVDVTMGFGTNYLGHSPDYVMRAVEQQLQRGFEIGPQSPLAGENAQLICELTGMERATFCNTGSEAVMAALRVARTISGRNKIVYFRGDYHGIADEVLGRPALVDGVPGAMPISPGVPHLANVIVLEYGDPASLETIKTYAEEIAAVLVEPVQARHPDLQPREFLQQLRGLTEQNEIALIFDEVITGFRIAPGGAQEYFGVRADMATYGKVIGGGMPIGVLAGKAKFMDVLDGGQWQYGDDSFPEVGVTFFAGTFVRHPLAMAAANAALKHLKAAGPALQQGVIARTARFTGQVNAFFQERGLPMRLQPFSSIFYYDFHPDLHYAGLLFYYLRDRGVHIWEGRVCHLSTAHTDADVDFVLRALKESVLEMQAAGFLPDGPAGQGGAESTADGVRPTSLPEAGSPRLAEFPPTDAQTEMWVAAQMRPEASGSHIGSNIARLSGPLDRGVLKRVIAEVIDRHEALRCTFSQDGTRIVVAPSLAYDLPIHELGDLSQAKRDARVEEILREDGQRIFDLTNGPLFAFRLIELSAREHLLVFTVQMIVCDGWSITLVLEDVSSLYSAAIEGRQLALPPATPMHEYVEWQRLPSTVAEVNDCETYWLSRFKTLPPPFDLPSFRARPPVRSFEGDRHSLQLEPEFYQAVKRTAKELGSTPFALLLSAYQNWLYRLSGLDDLAIGVPFAGQGASEHEGLVGQCVHTLPMRFKLDPEEPFSGLVRKTRDLIIDAQEHWNYSFGSLVQKLDLPRDPSRIPLVSAIFNLDVPMSKVRFAGCDQQITASPRYYFQYDIGFNLVDEGRTLLIECDYNRNLFDAETIRRWVGHFRSMLEGVVADPKQPLNRLPILSGAERARLLAEWSRTDAEIRRDTTVQHLISVQTARTPDAIALESGNERLTYAELERRANQLGHHLRALGVGPDSLVGVCLRRGFDMVVGVLGVLKAGGAYVPIDPDLPGDRIALMLADAAAPILLTHSAQLSNLPETEARIVCLDEDSDVIGKESIAPVPAGSGPENLAYVIYTSGSTGRPKGVEIRQGAVVNFLESMRSEPGMRAPDVVLGLTTLSFDIAVLEIFLPLIVGARIVIVDREVSIDPYRLAETVARKGITIMQATPATWRMLLNAGWKGSPNLKVLCGGEAMSPDLADRLLGLCGELWNMYGPTETTVWSTLGRLRRGEPISLGRPIANTRIYILDEQRQPVPIGVSGELLIGGAGLARGYRNRPELTEEKFVPDPFADDPTARLYRTGDLVRSRPNGDIEYIGRLDFQVKLRGYRIELGEIESILLGHPRVREAVAMVREDTPGRPVLVAYVAAALPKNSPELAGLRSELRQIIKQKLPDYMVPSAFVVLDELPHTPQNKIDRLELSPPPLELLESSDNYVAARNPTEKALARIWAETINIKQVGIRDNFFELGGQSLLAVSLFAKIEREFGKRLPLAVLFKAPTIEQMAGILKGDSAGAEPWGCLVAIQPKGTKPPLFLVHGAGGNILLYSWLAQHLAPEYPLYGLQSKGLDGKSAPLNTVSEMAVEYLKEIRAVRPQGPYCLGGYCLGGTVAYEIAQMLQEAGEEVALVAMLDTYNFSQALKSSFFGFMVEKIKFHFGNFIRLRPKEMIKYVAEKVRIARDGELANLLTSKPGSTMEPGISRAESGIEASVQAINDHAADHYLPKPYAGRLALFKPRVNYKFYPDPKMGWGDLALGGLDIVQLPVNPHAMLVEPYVRLLAAELKARLDAGLAKPADIPAYDLAEEKPAEALASR